MLHLIDSSKWFLLHQCLQVSWIILKVDIKIVIDFAHIGIISLIKLQINVMGVNLKFIMDWMDNPLERRMYVGSN